MPFLSSSDRSLAEAISGLTYCNPFLPERLAFERQALGAEYVDAPLVWSLRPDDDAERPNIERLRARVDAVVERLCEQLGAGAKASERDLALYEDLVIYKLFEDSRVEFATMIGQAMDSGRAVTRAPHWPRFAADFERTMCNPVTLGHDAAHLFACFYQIHRAFRSIFAGIIGGSMPAAQLRAEVWQSIFTHDLRRYARVLYRHLGDMTTLVTGPSGTGKELVAASIGLSRYIPFDVERQSFTEDYAGGFFPLNLSALSPTLIESELFGHKRGAFTGAVGDRSGWLEVCPRLGTVFLDEVGELDPSIQVKLLRVLQTRKFQRLGDTADRMFHGKVIAATNRDLAQELEAGRMREDFYYRLCSDIITTPSLREQLVDTPEDIRNLVRYIAGQIVGEEAETITDEVIVWIDEHLGPGYAWPGNIRELEQCVRNIVIRCRYEPARRAAPGAGDRLLDQIRGGRLTADELLCAYCTMVYASSGSYEEAARRLAIDRRTVKAKIDRAMLDRLRQ